MPDPDRFYSEYHIGVTYFRGTRSRPKIDQIGQASTGYSYANASESASGMPTTQHQMVVSTRQVGTNIPPTAVNSTTAIRVTQDGEACEIYDTETGEVFLSSRGSDFVIPES